MFEYDLENVDYKRRGRITQIAEISWPIILQGEMGCK